MHGIFQARVLEWGAIAFSELEARHFIIKTVENKDGFLVISESPC